MIHTDGTPTISNDPRRGSSRDEDALRQIRELPETEEPMTEPKPPVVLDTRQSAGVSVCLIWSRDTGRLYVTAQEGEDGQVEQVEVTAATALDAFKHPYAYLPRP